MYTGFEVFRPDSRDFTFDLIYFRDFSPDFRYFTSDFKGYSNFREYGDLRDCRPDFRDFRSDFRTVVHRISEVVCPSI